MLGDHRCEERIDNLTVGCIFTGFFYLVLLSGSQNGDNDQKIRNQQMNINAINFFIGDLKDEYMYAMKLQSMGCRQSV